MIQLDRFLQPARARSGGRAIRLGGKQFTSRRLPALPAGQWASCGELEFCSDEPLPEADLAQTLFLLSGGELDPSGVVSLSYLGRWCIGYSLRTPDVLWVAAGRS